MWDINRDGLYYVVFFDFMSVKTAEELNKMGNISEIEAYKVQCILRKHIWRLKIMRIINSKSIRSSSESF